MRGGRERQGDGASSPWRSPHLHLSNPELSPRKCWWCCFDAAYITQRSDAERMPPGPALPRLTARNWATSCHLLKSLANFSIPLPSTTKANISSPVWKKNTFQKPLHPLNSFLCFLLSSSLSNYTL